MLNLRAINAYYYYYYYYYPPALVFEDFLTVRWHPFIQLVSKVLRDEHYIIAPLPYLIANVRKCPLSTNFSFVTVLIRDSPQGRFKTECK